MVLVVEDETLIRLVACEALADAGFEVMEAEHSDEAATILRNRATGIHAVFTDVHLTGSMDGLQLAHMTRRSWPWIALLIASGKARPHAREMPEGSRFLPKPYELLHVVHHLRDMVPA